MFSIGKSLMEIILNKLSGIVETVFYFYFY